MPPRADTASAQPLSLCSLYAWLITFSERGENNETRFRAEPVMHEFKTKHVTIRQKSLTRTRKLSIQLNLAHVARN